MTKTQVAPVARVEHAVLDEVFDLQSVLEATASPASPLGSRDGPNRLHQVPSIAENHTTSRGW
jgi:hypothetical protein